MHSTEKRFKIVLINLQKRIRLKPRDFNRLRKTALKTLGLGKKITSGEISVCLMGNKDIKQLNLMYLARNCATDVIAFNTSGSNNKIAADIAVSADAAATNARVYRTSALYELNLYVVHGILHILGYDDDTDNKRKLMQGKAEKILTGSYTCQYTKQKQ